MGLVEKMNFAKWILRRIANTFNGGNQWEWIQDYRSLILRDKPLSMLATVGCGIVWFLLGAVPSVLLLPDRHSIGIAFQFLLYSIPAFYVYNWLAALHEIYQAEVMRTWNTLKETK
jgi:hypothetical protein